MAITFRHDAAAVVPPSNQSTRKYGQSLVLQQQQQKYDSQQAGYDRMFDAYKMENQQQFQDKRDTKQVINQQLRDWQQQDFQKQQMEAARQQQFMDDARKLSSGMIMDDIKNGHYDPATAGKLRKNLVDEADALADKTLDATQRKKVLDAIRADRLLNTSNRMEKPPQPTATDRFNQRKHFDEESGQWFIENSKGDFVPLVDPKQQQQQEKLQQQQLQQQEQEAQKMRPKSMEEYYSDNEDKFDKDLNTTMKSMQEEQDLITDPKKRTPVTKESALDRMKKDYDFRQKALGRSQYGEPTLAAEAPKPIGQTLGDAWNAYTKDLTLENFKKYHDAYRSNATLSDLADKAIALPEGSKEKKDAWDLFHAERDRIINGGTQSTPEIKSILEQPGQQPTPAAPAPSTPTPVASQSSLDQLDALAEAKAPSAGIPQGRFYGNDSYTNNAMDQALKSLSNGKAASAAAPSQNVSQPAPTQPGAAPAGPQTQQERITELLKAEGMANPDAPKAESDPRIAEVLKREGMANPDEPKQNVDPKLLLQEAANYPWLKQPGKLMSENKAGQASSPITIETASVAAKQYEAASQQLQTLQSQAAAMDAKIQSLQGRTGRSGVRSTQTNQEIARLKKERQQLNLGIRSAQNTMQASDKSVRGYYDQEVAKQPAVQALAKAGKRPQDFAQAEFQLKNLRMQYPDMSTMPAEAKKQLKEAMAIIQAGR